MIRGRDVVVRPIETADQSFIHELNADAGVRGRVVGWDWPNSLTAQEQWFQRQSPSDTHRWLVTTSEKQPLGLTGLWDVDWHNRNALTALKIGGSADVRGRGYGPDAIMAVMAFAFYDVGLHRLHSSILADNAPSVRAYVEKCGWSLEGTSREHIWRHGRAVDLLQIGILRSDFDRLPLAEEYVSRMLGRDL
ncbi:GNAT family N-acetyltransferase [Janibacter melonis]|uniref:GNAT family N-acetyltransferase n=1 Tax=Janibacter melonis TaxID=262209 RepID=UPI00174EC7E0|nr:GNAT family protein [Janibacter melonis]